MYNNLIVLDITAKNPVNQNMSNEVFSSLSRQCPLYCFDQISLFNGFA